MPLQVRVGLGLCSLSPGLGLQRETSRLAEYLVLRPRGDAEPRGGHVRAADGLDLFNATELRLGEQLGSNENHTVTRLGADLWPST